MSLDFPKPPAWTERANCATTDPAIFFPPKGGRVRAARKVCASCPVVAQCLEFALEIDDRHGIYGGLTVEQREQVRRKRAS
jgi:WhiB family redox-sensing transcriptional regulator